MSWRSCGQARSWGSAWGQGCRHGIFSAARHPGQAPACAAPGGIGRCRLDPLPDRTPERRSRRDDRHSQQNSTLDRQLQVLRLVAMTLKSNIKGQDIAARYGGEEFAAVLPETDLEGAIILADNIRKAVQAKELLKRSTDPK